MIEFDSISPFFSPFITTDGIGAKGDYFDLHFHTTASDSAILPKFFIEFLKDKRYLLAVTDHNEIAGAVRLHDLGLNVVPGIELGFIDGFELLVYFKDIEDLKKFFNTYVAPHRHPQRMARTTKDVFFFLDLLKDFDCHISIPHISGYAQKNFVKNKKYIHRIIEQVDSIETYNQGLSKKKNIIARDLRINYNKSATFGSDAHGEKEIFAFQKLLSSEEAPYEKFLNYFTKIKSLGKIGKKHLNYYIKNRKKRHEHRGK